MTEVETRLGRNVSLCEGTVLETGVEVGNNVTFYPEVTVGRNTRIFDGAVIGRPPLPTDNITRAVDAHFRPLIIGERSVIGANSVLYTGITIGKRVLIGDLTTIREGCELANDTVVGRGVMLMYDSKIGARSRIFDGSIITGNMLIEEDVFIGPGVCTINDDDVYLARFGLKSIEWCGPVIRRFAVVGTGANLSSKIEVGMGAIVAPGAMVRHDVAPWTVVAGVPAKYLRDVHPQERRAILKHFGINASNRKAET